MFKKILLSVACAFSLSAVAMDMSEGFSGSFELKYRHDLSTNDLGPITYRARTGWMGTANDLIKWGIMLSSDEEAGFSSSNFQNLNLEQAWVSYSPLKSFRLKIGKFQMRQMPNVYGALYDDDYYAEGVMAKFMHKINDGTKVYVVATHTDLDGYGDFDNGVTRISLGVKNRMNNVGVHAGLGAESDQLVADGAQETTYARGFVSVSTQQMSVPLTLFGMLSASTDDFDNKSYTAGIQVGKAQAVRDVSVHISYYDVAEHSWAVSGIDSDYFTGAGNGVNVKAQYNLFENTQVVAKYNYDLSSDDNEQGLVGELTVNF